MTYLHTLKTAPIMFFFSLLFALSAAVGLAWLLMNALMLEIFAFGMFQVLHCSWLCLNFTLPISFIFFFYCIFSTLICLYIKVL